MAFQFANSWGSERKVATSMARFAAGPRAAGVNPAAATGPCRARGKGCDTLGPKPIWSPDIWSPIIGPQLIGPYG